MVHPKRPSSPLLAVAASSKHKRFVRRTARMSTGGKRPIRQSTVPAQKNAVPQAGVVAGQQVLQFPTKEALAHQGQLKILERMRVLRRPLRSYKLGTAQKYMNNGVDTAYVAGSWIEHPQADFQREAVGQFLTDAGLFAHSESFTGMGVVSGDDLLNLSLEMRSQAERITVKDALGLSGVEWIRAKAVLMGFARPAVWVLDD